MGQKLMLSARTKPKLNNDHEVIDVKDDSKKLLVQRQILFQQGSVCQNCLSSSQLHIFSKKVVPQLWEHEVHLTVLEGYIISTTARALHIPTFAKQMPISELYNPRLSLQDTKRNNHF